jgi:hypothetical protein
MPSSCPTEKIECPLCSGAGELSRAEILDRLGVKDFARVAQLSAEEAFRLLHDQHQQDGEALWARFQNELGKRSSEIEQQHRDEIHCLGARAKELESAARVTEQQKAHEIQNANRRVEDTLRELAAIRERNQELEIQMSKVARRGKLEEVSFEEEVRAWPGIGISEKLGRNGDYLLAFRDPSGTAMEPRMLVDCKDKATLTEPDVKKLIRDAKERKVVVGIIVTRDEAQLRQTDRESRWAEEGGVWILRTTRDWVRRDLDVLRPLLDRMRTEGADFLKRNGVLADEIRRTLVDLDRIEGELKKASKSIIAATGLVTKYQDRLQSLCDTATPQKIMPAPQLDDRGLAEAGDYVYGG